MIILSNAIIGISVDVDAVVTNTEKFGLLESEGADVVTNEIAREGNRGT